MVNHVPAESHPRFDVRMMSRRSARVPELLVAFRSHGIHRVLEHPPIGI
jgi:hypothetical protein